jgi:DNA modification methylase
VKLGPFALPGYYVGDCRGLLAELPDDSVHCVVTSPPYWGLRDYGVAGQLGLERTPEEYVAVMVGVFREVRRVLRADGTLWLNLGDCYATGAGKVGDCPGGGAQGERWAGRSAKRGERTRALRDGRHAGKHTAMAALGPMTQPNRLPIPGLKPKDLVGIPWRVAFALQADGWWLRSDVIWAKPNPMPESVVDRPTKAHEYVFLLTKSEAYQYDADAIREPLAAKTFTAFGTHPRSKGGDRLGKVKSDNWARTVPDRKPRLDSDGNIAGANKRSVWTVGTEPTPDAHFATFPRKLVEPCILAGCPAGGVVLDPFGGSGTVGRVAEDLGRKWLLFDLNPKYQKIADRKTAQRSLLQRVTGGAA